MKSALASHLGEIFLTFRSICVLALGVTMFMVAYNADSWYLFILSMLAGSTFCLLAIRKALGY